jgi:PAS domain S-box-containing protein
MEERENLLSISNWSLNPKYAPPLRIFMITIVGIFVAEIIAMIAVYYLEPRPYWFETLLDATIMTVMIFPIVYFFSFRPLLTQITERKRSEELIVKVLENLPVGVWIIDQYGKVVHGNPASQQIWGGARYVGIEQYGEYKGWRTDSEKRLEPEEWAAARAIQHGETTLNEEIKIECFDGSQKIILNSAIPIFEQGLIQGVIVVNQDITERKQYLEALVHSNELLEKAFNSIDILIAYMDREFNFIQVNETYARSAGHPVGFFNGKNHFELYPHPENQAIFQRVVETGEPFSVLEKPFEYAEYPERGVTYWNWSLQPVNGADGTVQGVVLSLVDVTERKRAELQLERQNRELRDLSNTEHKLRGLSESLIQSMLALNTSLNLEEVLNAILEQIWRAIPSRFANIILVEGNTIRIVRYPDSEGPTEGMSIIEKPYLLENYTLFRKVYTTQQPVLIEDTNESGDWQVVPGMEQTRSYVAAPLIVDGHVTGTINLASDQPGAFNQETVGHLMVFAAPAAVAVQNVRLYRAELHSRQLAETLSAVSLALTQTLNFDTVINTLMEFVCRLIPYECAYIAISENETRLTVRAARSSKSGKDPAQILNLSVDPWDLPNLQEVYSTQNSLLIPDTRKYPGWSAVLEDENIRNWLGIPMVAGGNVIGILAMAKNEPEKYTREHVRLAEGIVAQASVAIQNAWLFEQVRSGHERLQSLSRRLVEIQESERSYIARELHDETSQALTAVKFGLRLLEQEVDHPESLLKRVADLKQLTDKILEELHRLAMDLRPASLDHLGLLAALEQLVKSTCDRYKLDVHFKTQGFSREDRFPDYMETSMYRIVQEALTNAVRHAGASNVDVILEFLDGKAVVIIEDDGAGFDTAAIRKSGHLGLLGMQERAQAMGGTLLVESRPGGGTTVVVEVPYVDPNLDRR